MKTRMNERIREILLKNAARYETAAFLEGDPSSFMHRVKGEANKVAMAFVASSLSFGARKQFMAKIEFILKESCGEMDRWIREGGFRNIFDASSTDCFYRFYKVSDFAAFLEVYRALMREEGTLGEYVKKNARGDGVRAVEAISGYFSSRGVEGIIPKDSKSACKRLCMFLRWMVRANSPVDLGLWSPFIDSRSLAMPLDTHVLRQAKALGLIKQNASPSMRTARALSEKLSEVFCNDPLKGDFALFGYGVNSLGAT